MQVSDEDQVHFSIYRTEVGSRTIGEALADEHLFKLCQDCGDAYASLKLMISYTSGTHKSLPLGPSYTQKFYTIPPPVITPRTNDTYSPTYRQIDRGPPQGSPSSPGGRLSQGRRGCHDAPAPDNNTDAPRRHPNGITIQDGSLETLLKDTPPLVQLPPSATFEGRHAGTLKKRHLPSHPPQSLPLGDSKFPSAEDKASRRTVGTPVPTNWGVSWIAPSRKTESKALPSLPPLTYLSSRGREDLRAAAAKHPTPQPLGPRRTTTPTTPSATQPLPVAQNSETSSPGLISPSREPQLLGPQSTTDNAGTSPQAPSLAQSLMDQTKPNNRTPPPRELIKPSSLLNPHPNNRVNVFDGDFKPLPEEMCGVKFSPMHGFDEPVAEATSGEISLTSTRAVQPPPTPERLEHETSIRTVTNEHKRELDHTSRVIPANHMDIFRKGSIGIWGEVISERVENAPPVLSASAESPSEPVGMYRLWCPGH